MSAPLKNVAITGASGNLGSVILAKLAASPNLNVRVLRRNGSASAFAPATHVVNVDFDSVDSLAAALEGQDALVAPLHALAVGLQHNMVEACIKAGVDRFIPSEFGSDLDNPKARALPIFASKVQFRNFIEEKAKTSPITYTYVVNGPFLDWGLEHEFIMRLSNGKPVIFDGGDYVFSATTLDSIADAVVGILAHPEETKNRTVYIEDVKISQNKLLALAKEVAPGKSWEPEPASLDEAVSKAGERLAQGIKDTDTFVPFIFRSFVDPAYGGNFAKTDNALLGIKGKTEEEVANMIKSVLK
ncbi:hypothetical protein CDD81_7274 [Ophiocordyceps australis]|uniref:NmrA-like domain-containing protein n=1 Tax=Ophiocordyceps australis TaxID=1399860 RepID=A0A2C5Y3N1_9HYPO|nr:hypothetical protein CDD81_7274 [Ophiocordyceps australis]